MYHESLGIPSNETGVILYVTISQSRDCSWREVSTQNGAMRSFIFYFCLSFVLGLVLFYVLRMHACTPIVKRVFHEWGEGRKNMYIFSPSLLVQNAHGFMGSVLQSTR